MPPTLFAYFGPETILPMTSIVAAIGGFLLMFGKNVLGIPARIFRLIVGKRPAANPASSSATSSIVSASVDTPVTPASPQPVTEKSAQGSQE